MTGLALQPSERTGPQGLALPASLAQAAPWPEICGEHGPSHCTLISERQDSALREQFIAVLGHDLRNPLAAIISGMEIISRSPLNARQTLVTNLVQSSAARMSALIDDVMDLARGRLGDGMVLKRAPVLMSPVLTSVIDELRSSQRSRTITAKIDLAQPVDCDHGRLCQLLSNLISNALVHGSETGPVHICATCDGDDFVLSVSNSGEPIPTTAIARLFHPFARGDIRPSQQGLGLGLYIASQIALAHGGQLTAKSDPDETRFTFCMPLCSPAIAAS